MKKSLALTASLLSLFSGLTIAAPSCPNVHTWHIVSTQTGHWKGTLTVINQEGGFVNEQCEEISQFDIQPNESFNYGMYFKPGSDFNFTYTLAMAKQPEGDAIMDYKYPICHFLISAYSPANPQIYTTEMNDANCQWQVVPGVGEDFQVN